jgi:hypothetical protein
MKESRPQLILLLLGLPGLANGQDQKPAPYPAMAPVEQYRIANAQDLRGGC